MTVNHWVPGSSPGRGAKFKASVHTGAFYCLRTLTRDYVPGYSLRSPLRGRAKARSAKAVESRSRSQIQSLGSYRGFLLPADSHQGLRPRLFASLTPFGAALKRSAQSHETHQVHPPVGASLLAIAEARQATPQKTHNHKQKHRQPLRAGGVRRSDSITAVRLPARPLQPAPVPRHP